ncbi:hypothetical protein [Pseudoalteromonas umbrosa]|uniref:hypothetical protein n=1 Tax=Pseudoalteromonas umbrosa TaxID=3048489 RepID=UPI0024C3DE51|nr:hypothetical protein [Pseudoalteromonas sp. B95]MDK1287592.1 hypothetical protein [Pseudoalteromonas sp. B95]
MMKLSNSSKLPFIFLTAMSSLWFFYFNTQNLWNDYGKEKWEWLFLIDVLIAIPVICFICVKDKKEALLKALILICLAVLIGSYIIPDEHKVLWSYLEQSRYLVLAIVLLFELAAVFSVYWAINIALKKGQDPDLSIEQSVSRYLGTGKFAQFLCFEIRMWTFALVPKRIHSKTYQGNAHFSYHQKDGTHSNLLGFIILIAIEIPIVHLLLHFIWSPMAANIVSLLTIFSLVFFIAEYRAIAKRPISLTEDTLIVRYGLYNPIVIPLNNILDIKKNHQPITRGKNLKRFNYSGVPNIEIILNKPKGTIKSLFIGVDDPTNFIASINSRLAS